MLRLTLDIVLIYLFFITPWWVVLLYTIVLLFLFDNFFELLLLGIGTDILFGYDGFTFVYIPLIYTFFYTGLFVFLNFIKKRLRHKHLLL